MSEQKIPAPILTYLTHAAEEAGKRDVAAFQEVSLERQINDLDAEIQRLTALRKAKATDHAKAGRDREEAQLHAKMHRAAAAYLAEQSGLDPQKVLACEPAPIPPAQDTPREPGPNDVGRFQYSTCVHCADRIVRDDASEWMHASGTPVCYPAASSSPLAEPVPQDDPLGQNGQEVAR